ncbi:hypothetical protein [Kiloniella sp. b19]|uniref:hypothetical protein n=1 Tax=Kiloniella sp. GXU_MW_B19 TaxID=3141326 RepID=UPI0031E0E59F
MSKIYMFLMFFIVLFNNNTAYSSELFEQRLNAMFDGRGNFKPWKQDEKVKCFFDFGEKYTQVAKEKASLLAKELNLDLSFGKKDINCSVIVRENAFRAALIYGDELFKPYFKDDKKYFAYLKNEAKNSSYEIYLPLFINNQNISLSVTLMSSFKLKNDFLSEDEFIEYIITRIFFPDLNLSFDEYEKKHFFLPLSNNLDLKIAKNLYSK